MLLAMLPSSTNASGQTRASNSSLVTSRPASSTSTSKVSKAFGVSAIDSPSRKRDREETSSRNGPNSKKSIVSTECRLLNLAPAGNEVVAEHQVHGQDH